ncbi:hypothetical protein FXO38_00218 [Capsicum annuum]|nr:hypothetical protein FXO38_00218 [Capsicum annuum]
MRKTDDYETDEHAQEHVVPPGSTIVQTEGILIGGTTNKEMDASVKPTQVAGSEFTFEEFTKEFKELYFRTNDNEVWRPSIEEIKGEYWRIIEKPKDEVEVNYEDDLETGVFGSGFPLESSSPKASTSDLYATSAIESYFSRQSMPQWDVLSSQNGRHKFDYVDISEISIDFHGRNGFRSRRLGSGDVNRSGCLDLDWLGIVYGIKRVLVLWVAFGNEQEFGIAKLGRAFVVCSGCWVKCWGLWAIPCQDECKGSHSLDLSFLYFPLIVSASQPWLVSCSHSLDSQIRVEGKWMEGFRHRWDSDCGYWTSDGGISLDSEVFVGMGK